MEIPGWAPIAKKRLKSCPGAQLVNGQWYMPSLGCGFGYGKTGDEAIAVLREFGIVDEMGHVVEGVSRGGS
jgi:hypothetical protein